MSDLARLPRLTREIVRREARALRARDAWRYRPKLASTSGTSTEPLEFLIDRGANVLEFVYYWRHWSWAGYRLGDPFAELGSMHFLRRPSLAGASVAWQPHLRRLMLNAGRISVRHVQEMARSIRRHRARFIKGMASTLFFFARCLEEARERDISFRAAFSTGEVLTGGFRKQIAAMLHCPVLDSYGHMERTVAISECLQGGLHLNSDYGVLELVDRRAGMDGTTIRGRVVGTSLYNRAMPLIRYETDDEIEVFEKPEPCRCGRGLPLVKAIHGRREDAIVTPDGRYVTSMFILPQLVKGIGFAQFEQRSPEDLEIRVVPSARWNPQEAANLMGYARDLLGPHMRVQIRSVPPEEIVTDASGKRRRVISRVPGLTESEREPWQP